MTTSTKAKWHYERRRSFLASKPDPLIMRECPQEKLAFTSERIALQKVNIAKKRGTTLFCYKCPHCHLWHLTSKVPR